MTLTRCETERHPYGEKYDPKPKNPKVKIIHKDIQEQVALRDRGRGGVEEELRRKPTPDDYKRGEERSLNNC